MKALHTYHHYPVALACQLFDLPRSSYYYQSHKADERQLEQDMQQVVGEYVCYGSRRTTQQLRRAPYGYHINRKRTQRIMRQHDWLQPVRKKKYRTTNSEHPYPRYDNLVKDLSVTHPDQVWVADVTYVRLGHGFVFLAILLDVFTRAIRGWHLSTACDTQLTLTALRRALVDRVPLIHHSDQGGTYAAYAYIDELKAYQIQISMAAVGKAEENGYAERFMRTVKEEEVDLSDYRDFADAQNQIGQFIEAVYNHKRIHSSLGYLTPAEFEAVYRARPEAAPPLA